MSCRTGFSDNEGSNKKEKRVILNHSTIEKSIKQEKLMSINDMQRRKPDLQNKLHSELLNFQENKIGVNLKNSVSVEGVLRKGYTGERGFPLTTGVVLDIFV